MAEPVLVLPRAEYRRNRKRWLAARANGIGGSDAAAVLGLSPWASPLSLWVEKTRPLSDVDERSEAMRWGTVFETAIARELAREHGIRLGPCPGLLRHPERDYQLATIDRYGLDRRTKEPNAVVEVKNVTAWKAEEWQEAGPPPDHVVIQVQHQLDVTGLDVGYVAAVVGGNSGRWWQVERDNDLISMLRAAEAEFWQLVRSGAPPGPIGHDADGDALAALYAGDPDREVVLNGATRADLAHLRALKARMKDDEAAAEALEQRVKAALGDATEGLLPDGTTAVTWRPGTTTRLDQARLKAERPDIWEQFATTTEGRRLLVKKTKENTDATAAA